MRASCVVGGGRPGDARLRLQRLSFKVPSTPGTERVQGCAGRRSREDTGGQPERGGGWSEAFGGGRNGSGPRKRPTPGQGSFVGWTRHRGHAQMVHVVMEIFVVKILTCAGLIGLGKWAWGAGMKDMIVRVMGGDGKL